MFGFGTEGEPVSRWKLEYTVDAVGDTPLPKSVEVEIDTDGLDVYGEDEQLVMDRLRAALAAQRGEGAQLTGADQIGEATG